MLSISNAAYRGLGLMVFARIFGDHNTGGAKCEIKDQRIKLTEVTGCHHISGEGRFEITFMTTDLEAYSRLAMQPLINLSNAKDLHTSFSLGEVKASHGLPLGHLQRLQRDLFHHEAPGFYLDSVVNALFNVPSLIH